MLSLLNVCNNILKYVQTVNVLNNKNIKEFLLMYYNLILYVIILLYSEQKNSDVFIEIENIIWNINIDFEDDTSKYYE